MNCQYRKEQTLNGYKTSEVKSGICKYFRRGKDDKFAWCVFEMLEFNKCEDGKRLVSNLLNRLKILLMEDISTSEGWIVLKGIELLNDFEKSGRKDTSLINDFCGLVVRARKSRDVSYVKYWYSQNPTTKYKSMGELKYKKDDPPELVEIGENFLRCLNERNLDLVGWFLKAYELDVKASRRYRRTDGIYLLWELLEQSGRVGDIINFGREMFYRKSMSERKSFGVWCCMVAIADMNWEQIEMKRIEIYQGRLELDDYVLNDYHVDRRFGLDDFRVNGAFVPNEDCSFFENENDFMLMKTFYMYRTLESRLEFVDFNDFEILQVLEEGVCGMKKCCIKVKFNGGIYVLKEMGKGLNYGRDYMFLDCLKKDVGLIDLGMRRIASNYGMERVDCSKKTLVGNWKFVEKNAVYCMMKFKDNCGDLCKNKHLLQNKECMREMLKIRLFDGLFKSSDNILRNILVGYDDKLTSIDEGDVFGKRDAIFSKHEKYDEKLICEIIKELKERIDVEKVKRLLKEYELNCQDIFVKRFEDYENIVKNEIFE